MSGLPLRLIFEPLLVHLLGPCFILPTIHESEICFVVNDRGLVCLIQDKIYPNDYKCSVLGLDISYLPDFVLVNNDRWYQGGTPCDIPDKEKLLSKVFPTNSAIAKIIVEGIERYYGRQVLEPSIRGFLSILEKQFPRNDLYLFELLQNSVDDGANHVIFKAIKDKNIEKGLLFTHNGRNFNPLDVLGLASVGLSTKGADSVGSRRTIGFMGVGFKAVYKRFRKVTIHDGTWRFIFEEPVQHKPIPPSSTSTIAIPIIHAAVEPAHAWVMKPKWVDTNLMKDTLWDVDVSSSTKSWCHFQLECLRTTTTIPSDSHSNTSISNFHQRIDKNSLENELRYLPETIPPLLGRQAISNFSKSNLITAIGTDTDRNTWTLEWGGTKYIVSKRGLDIDSSFPAEKQWKSRSECIQVEISTPNPTTNNTANNTTTSNKLVRYWQFVYVSFQPDTAAQEAYLTHTKKSWTKGNNPTSMFEDTAFFFEIDRHGHPLVTYNNNRTTTATTNSKDKDKDSDSNNSTGKVHAILPTKLKLSCPFNWQASW